MSKNELVFIKNDTTGHEVPISKKAWETHSHLYSGYRLVTDEKELKQWKQVDLPKAEVVPPAEVKGEPASENDVTNTEKGGGKTKAKTGTK